MTLLEIELAVLALVGIVATVTLWIAASRLVDRVYARQVAMDGHAKAATREALIAKASAVNTATETEQLREDVRLMLERVDRHMSNPHLKRMLGEDA